MGGETGLFRVHGVRYQTRDVNRAVAFYTQELGFELKHQHEDACATILDPDGNPIELFEPAARA